jgi:hypothetical protein
VFSALIVLVLVLVLVLGWGIEAGLPGWKRWRKQAAEGSLGSPERRDEDEGRRRGRLGHGAKHILAVSKALLEFSGINNAGKKQSQQPNAMFALKFFNLCPSLDRDLL